MFSSARRSTEGHDQAGGENVASRSREVEEAIYRLAGVSEVAVVGLPHPRWVEALLKRELREAHRGLFAS